MKSLMLSGIAAFTLSAALAGGAVAQQMPAQTMQPPGTETPPAPDNVPVPADQPGMGATQADPMKSDPMKSDPMQGNPTQSSPTQADPNAAMPTGAVAPNQGMMPAPADAPRDPAAPVGSSSNPVTVGGNVTPPPTDAKDYPLCSRTVQDSCINPGEAKRKASRR